MVRHEPHVRLSLDIPFVSSRNPTVLLLPSSPQLLLALAAASASGDRVTRPPAPAAPPDTSIRYIVPEAAAPRFYHQGQQSSAYFEPSEADVTAFEVHLAAFLRASKDKHARAVASKLAGYRRQFVGVVVGGRRLIFGNFFCRETPATEPVDVDDGGDCYFELFYDPTSHEFSRLYIHGEA
jgi:hypothetical protein